MSSVPSPQELAKGYQRRAQALLDVRRWQDALAALNESLRLDPEPAETFCYLTMALRQGGRLEEALAAADEAIKRDPNTEWPHRLRSVTAKDLGDHEAALRSACEARRLAPNVWQATYCVASSLYQLRRFGEAREMAEAARTLAPDQVEPHNLLGLIALARKQLLEAEAQFRQALRVDPQSAQAHNSLGTALMRQGRVAEAVKFFGSSLTVDPSGQAVRENLGLGTRSLRRQTFLLSSRRLFERMSPGVYQYYLDLEGRSPKVIILTFLWKVFVPVTAAIAAFTMILRWMFGPIELDGIIVADLALNGFLWVMMSLFGWRREYLQTSAAQVQHISTLTALATSPLLWLAVGVAGLIYDEARWGFYIALAIAGGAFSIRLALKRARGGVYRLAARFHPSIRRISDRCRQTFRSLVQSRVGGPIWYGLSSPFSYVIVGCLGLYVGRGGQFWFLWLYPALGGAVVAFIRFIRREEQAWYRETAVRRQERSERELRRFAARHQSAVERAAG